MRRGTERHWQVAKVSVALGLLGACGGTASPQRSEAPSPVTSAADATKPATKHSTGAAPGAAPATALAAGWQANAHPELRHLTVLIRVQPPAPLSSMYRKLASQHPQLKSFLLGHAEGGFGSGFVMLWRDAAAAGATPKQRVFIVTNRHVVGLTDEVSVSFEGSEQPLPARVVLVDDHYDLALLSPKLPEKSPWDGGLVVETRPVRDQDVVIATGYPGIGDRPSYQVTRGYVSNQSFSLHDGGAELLYIQHTAPIDPGSSGGPLTSESGTLLGVNTLKVRERENVGLAVPASAVASALERVLAEPPPNSEAGAQRACEQLLERIRANNTDVLSLERAFGARLVASQDVEALAAMPDDETDWKGLFLDSPADALLRMLALRLRAAAAASQSRSSEAWSCRPRAGGAAGAYSFEVPLAPSVRHLDFAYEQARFKVVDGLPVARSHAQPAPAKWKPSLR